MEKEQRSKLQKATQEARRLLEEEFSRQLLETYDISVDKGGWSKEPGAHLQAEQRLLREKLLAWIEHKKAQIGNRKEALLLALREMAFTALNRFVALKLMEARELVRPCVSGGLESEGFQEFTAVAQGLLVEQESSYRLYLETIFEDVSRELRALFDPRDPASLLWPKRTALLDLLDILNRPELAELWREDETLGWIYQYFNGDAERKKMREESSAPRNSRELAVRNQFFTPRYVVEFLTDNTLGRIWYEMRQGQTGLKDRCRYLVRRPNEIWLQPGDEPPAEVVADETLSQEELLKQPVHIPHRPLKDPREIRMLDPACGSMHFGLYAFDLYLEIYEEAWKIAQGSDKQAQQGEAFDSFVAYAVNFANKAAFLREMPRLILQHNIHGIDIDPRATQIARLTLWLRAQRAWQEQGVEVAARPAISRSNVVCAEPMPGEKELLADFVDQQFPEAERGLVQELLETIFDKMQLAGEAGSLLKIEEEIRDAIEQARREWQKLAIQQRDLFSAAEMVELGGVGSSLNTDLQNLTKDFWIDIEERIYTALSNYAEKVQIVNGLQRRLFAEDAAQGFALIDICKKRYDVVLMNPPFGESAEPCREYFNRAFPCWNSNLLCASIQRGWEMATGIGVVGAIYDRTALVKTTYEEFRRSILVADDRLTSMADLGWDVLDANVEVTTSVLSRTQSAMSGIFLDVRNREPDQKENELLDALRAICSGEVRVNGITMRGSDFQDFPNAVVGYDFPEFLRRAFEESLALSSSGYSAFTGHQFKTDQHFRLWWEVSRQTPPIFNARLFNGAGFCPFWSPLRDVLISKVDLDRLPKNSSTNLRNREQHLKPGICFGKRGEYFCAHVLPSGHYFSLEGLAIPVPNSALAFEMLGVLNTPLTRASLNKFAGQHKTSGYVNLFPYRKIFHGEIARTTVESAVLSLLDAQRFDESLSFFQALKGARSIKQLAKTVDAAVLEGLNKSLECEKVVHDLVLKSYDVLDPEREELERFRLGQPTPESPLEDADIENGCLWFAAHSSISTWLGIVFGRWDILHATCEQSPPELFDPFAQLPVCPPGQLQNTQGFPASPEDLSDTYPVHIPWEGILVDDPNHPLDIELRVHEVLGIIGNSQVDSPTAEAIEHEACEILGVKLLRDYFRKPASFFADHLKRYSKSRRQAPIYWQLSAGNGNYSAWLYYHRFTQDTLYRLLGDFVEQRIQEAEREQFEFESQGGLSGDAASLLHEVQALLQDLRLFKSELELVAPLWNPNLNDGVIINHAILWRITPYTPWQKKCKECWDKLVKGDYDWAHLAFHLWPERVIRKCTTDRSLAIAHGLEERLWQDTNNGNWLQRQVSEAELQALIAGNSKPAVQNALERFLTASPPVAAARTRAPRTSKSSSTGSTRRPRGSAPEVNAETSRQTLLVLTAAPAEGLGRNAIAELLGVEAASLTAVIKQLKEGGQIEQLGAARGAKYRLSESGLAAVESQSGEVE